MPRRRSVITFNLCHRGFHLACLLALASILSGRLSMTASAEMRHITPPASDAVIFNPDMGLYLQYPPMDSAPDEWYMQIGDIAYYRLHWADVNPEEGVYTFDEFFGPFFNFWVKERGKRVAFGVMSQSMHGRMRYVTPKWVFDKGVPGVIHPSPYFKEDQIDPVFWDERYLEELDVFTRKLGEYLDGREGLEFIDMRGIGEWGEMHLARWTPEQLQETGFTEEKYVMAYRRMIDAFAEAFPHTRVFLNVGGQKHLTINDYAALHGMHFRQDGLKPGGASYNCGEWLYKPYSKKGVLCNFEFHSSYEGSLKKGWSPKETIDAVFAAPISYLNTGSWLGGGGLHTAPEEARSWLTQAASRLGYRFELVSLDVGDSFHLNPDCSARIPLRTVWRNRGLAPCRQSYALVWALLNPATGEPVFSQLQFPNPPTSMWDSEKEDIEIPAMLRVPGTLAPDDYQLSVAMVDPGCDRTIALAMQGRDEKGRYPLCSLRGIAGEGTGSSVVLTQDFEKETEGWWAAEGMTISEAAGEGHEGTRALRVTGTQVRGWNYASFNVPDALVPGGRYRLTAWMRVDRIDPRSRPPFIKLGVNDADGKWIDNFGSNRYDANKLGTWQKLTAFPDLPVNAVKGNIAIEKGVDTTAMTVDLWLDDVVLELLEAP